MQWMTRAQRLLAAVCSLAACNGDPTGELRNGLDHLIATPTAMFVTEGTTGLVVVEGVDEQGNRIAIDVGIANVGAGITVVEDDSFNPVVAPNGELVKPKHPTRVQFVITPTVSTASTSFTLRASGRSLTIPVRLVPISLTVATVNDPAPALGDTLTLSAPAPYKFTPESRVTGTGGELLTLAISADSSQVRAIPGPGISGPLSISDVIVSYAPAAGPFVLRSIAAVTTPALTSLPGSFAPPAPAGGQVVTLSLSGFKILEDFAVTSGGVESYIVSIAGDSSSVTFVPPPGSSGAPRVGPVALSFLLGVPLTLPTTTALPVGASPFPGTDDPATAPTLPLPGPGATSTFYDGGGFGDGLFGADRLYQFTLGATTTFSLTLDWSNDADIDLVWTDAAGDLVCNLDGATSSQPEASACTLPAGSYFLVVNLFAGAAPGVLQFTIAR